MMCIAVHREVTDQQYFWNELEMRSMTHRMLGLKWLLWKRAVCKIYK
jgi:hypothetical protein